MRRRLRLAIDDALDELPEEFRVAVVLRDVADLDYAEIAEVLVDPARHRQVEDRPRPLPARQGAREPRLDLATSNTPTDTMNDDQRLLANAYLDGEVSADERARAEADPEVVAEVARLRAVR